MTEKLLTGTLSLNTNKQVTPHIVHTTLIVHVNNAYFPHMDNKRLVDNKRRYRGYPKPNISAAATNTK